MQLTAQPDPGFKFVTWIGDLSGSENPQSLLMDSEWLATVSGYRGYSHKRVKAIFLDSQNFESDRLISGEPVEWSSCSYGPCGPDAEQDWRHNHYWINVPTGATQLAIRTTAGTDVDLYANRHHRGYPYRIYGENDEEIYVSKYLSTGPGGNKSITITPESGPPLEPGLYFIAVHAHGGRVEGTLTAEVNVSESAISANVPVFGFPASLFTTAEGETPPPQDLEIRNSGGGTLDYQITTDQSWLFVSPDQGSSTGETDTVEIVVDPANLETGTFEGAITITAPPAWPITVPVTLIVTPNAAPPFFVMDLSSVSLSTAGNDSDPLSVGYARVDPDTGAFPPSGVAIFGFTKDGVLVSEAAVPASVATHGGRIFAEVDGAITTGIAMANPNDEAVWVSFQLRDQKSGSGPGGGFRIGAREQIATFLDQAPFHARRPMIGTFSYTAPLPVAVVALRGRTNARGEFLVTTLPVAPLSSSSNEEVILPHFADGSGWTTEIVLVNPTDQAIGGTVRFLGQGSESAAAPPVSLMLDDGRFNSEFSYSIAPSNFHRLRTSNPAGVLHIGSGRVLPDIGAVAPTALVIFSLEKEGVTVSEAGVASLPAGEGFLVYAESAGAGEDQPGSIETGLAVANAGFSEASLVLELTDPQGHMVGPAATLQIPPAGQIAKFVYELFPEIPTPFSGVLRITSAGSQFAVVGLRGRTNERGDFLMTTIPPTNESVTPTAPAFFPHIADGSGWSTQFILFGGTAGQSSAGRLHFFTQSGEPWPLNLQ